MKLHLFWKVISITLFVLAICCVYYNNWKLGFIFGLSYNYVMFEVLTTFSEEKNK